MAGIFNRMSTLIRANLNSILDSAEDPEKVLDQIIRDMESAINDARGQVAELIARERLLQADLEKNRTLTDEWGRKAEMALTRSSDDLAREALRRKLDYQKNNQMIETQWQQQHEMVERLKADLVSLQERYESAVRQRDQLVARHKAAQALEQVNRTVRTFSTADPSSELARMEDRIRLREARAEAGVELREVDVEHQFAQLEGESDLDRELAQLKARVQGQLPSPGVQADKPS